MKMSNVARAVGLLIVAAVSFAAAIAFGVKGAKAESDGRTAQTDICCIYMIF